MFDRAIDTRRYRKIQRIEAGDDERTDRTKSVERLAACKLHVLALQIARGDVVDAGVAENVAERIVAVA